MNIIPKFIFTSSSYTRPRMVRYTLCRAVRKTARSTIIVSTSRLPVFTPNPCPHLRGYATSTNTTNGDSLNQARTLDIDIPTPDGSTRKVTIRPTPKAPATKLTEELISLLEVSPGSPAVWTLDMQGDAVHCAAVVPTRAEADKIKSRITVIADEMKHHPHVSADDMVLGCQMLITCTTHNPKGLGLRDVRLAAAVSGVMKECQSELQTEATKMYAETAVKQLKKHREEMECAVCT